MAVPGLDPGIVAGIHAFPLPSLPRMRGREASKQAWMAGTSPAMTRNEWFHMTGNRSSNRGRANEPTPTGGAWGRQVLIGGKRAAARRDRLFATRRSSENNRGKNSRRVNRALHRQRCGAPGRLSLTSGGPRWVSLSLNPSYGAIIHKLRE